MRKHKAHQICTEFLLLCCRPRKGHCSMETSRFGPFAFWGSEIVKFGIEFLLLCCIPRNRRFSMETGRFWPLCPLGT